MKDQPIEYVKLGFLRATVFCTGAIIMIVELLGTKIVAPAFGASLYTWTSLIAITLGALSVGYHFGGRIADKKPRPALLYQIIASSGFYLCLIPFLQYPVLSMCSPLGLRYGALVSAFIFFGPPLFLLGMVAPFAVKLAKPQDNIGQLVGSLYAISTIGSVIGTFATGFYLIPCFDNIQILIGCAAGLLLVSFVFFSVINQQVLKLKAGSCLVLAIACLLQLFVVFHPIQVEAGGMIWTLVHRDNSNYGNLRIIDRYRSEDEGLENKTVQRGLYNDGLCQTRVDLETGYSVSVFTYALSAMVRLYFTFPKNILCVGIGGGIVPMEYAKEGTNIDAVEISPQSVELAKKYFNYGHENIHTVIKDGRYFLTQSNKLYDAVVLDAFVGDAVPEHLITKEFFSLVKKKLSPSGVLAINFSGKTSGPGSESLTALYSTLKTQFKNVFVFSKRVSEVTNIYLMAADIPPVNKPQLKNVPTNITKELAEIFKNPIMVQEDKDLVLTDSFNPIEHLGLHSKEKVREYVNNEKMLALFL